VGTSSRRLGRIRPVVQRYVDEGKFAGVVSQIARRGEVAEGLVILVDGQAMVGHAESGQPLKAERVLHGPDWLDMSSAWCDGNFSGDALAQSPVAVATLPLSALRTLLGERPALALRFVDLLAREVCRLGAQAHELMHKDAPSRLAAWLGRQLDADGRSVLHLAERKRDIASQLGMTPETLSRLMRSLTEQGLIRVEGYTVRVLDAPALARLAGA
jgi:CRP-like cAMP-binding protein